MKLNFPNKKQRGQIIIMMMFAAIPLFLMMAFVANGGYLVAQKAKLQGAADTAALVEATWTARSLNIMSMNNTAAVQSHAIASAGMALERPLLDAGLTGGLVGGFYIGRMIAIGRLCPPWCFLLSVPVFGGLFASLEDKVLTETLELQKQVEYAMHDGRNLALSNSDDYDGQRGFARVAASFAKMNRILVEEFPEQIDTYSRSMSAANYDNALTEIHRYTAWSPEETTVEDVVMPVHEQSIEEAINEVGQAYSDGFDPDNAMSQGIGAIVDAGTRIKDLRDFYNAGKEGTNTNPYNSISLDYFGNFKKHGYAIGSGPFARLEEHTSAEFKPVFDDLTFYVTGEPPITGGDAPWYLKWALKLVKKLIKIFIGTPYELPGFPGLGPLDAETSNEVNFEQRFEQIYGWGTHYGEANFSDSVALAYGRWNIPLVGTFDWPKRATRGFPLGLYHGFDLSTYADVVGADQDVANQEVAEAEEDAKREFIEDCVKEGEDARKDQLIAQEIDRRRQVYFQEQQNLPASQRDNPPDPPDSLGFFELERPYLNQARAQLRVECETRFDNKDFGAAPDSPDGVGDVIPAGQGGDPDDDFSPDLQGINPLETNNDRTDNQNRKQAGGRGIRPKEGQDFLEYFNWMFEVHYQAMKLPFPFDSASYLAHRVIGDNTCPRFPGFICVYETPMYAVFGQRIVPEFVTDAASAGADALGIPPNFDFLPPAVKDQLSELGRNFAASRDDWSLLVSQQAPMRLLFAPAAFGTVPERLTVFAQSEVYNAEWFDLFTQSWKAKLVPVSLPRNDYHRPKIETAWTDKVDFIDVFETFQSDEQRIMNH